MSVGPQGSLFHYAINFPVPYLTENPVMLIIYIRLALTALI